jgi:DNA-binding PadR family transcriptional regulator
MKIGKVERLVLLLLKQHSMNTSALSTILRAKGHVKTGLSVRRAIKTLRLKGLIDHSNKLTSYGARHIKAIKNNESVNIAELDMNVLGNRLKLGIKEKVLLYILTKIDHASLQFLVMITKDHTKNISAVLNRLEDNGLVYGYKNMITFTNARGRRYRPKYYRITGLGTIVSSAIRSEISNMASTIDAMLEDTLKLKSEMSQLHGPYDKYA